MDHDAEKQHHDEHENSPTPARDLSGAVVSVVIPTYNSASILPDAIDSILAQTRPADEIIVVDDGGTDDTEGVCSRYGDKVRYLRHAENRFASAARNTGFEAATGDWLAFLDADDVWDSEKLELQLAALEQRPEAGFSVAATLTWSAADQTYYLCRYDGPLDPAVMRARLLIRNILSGICSSILVHRDALASVGGFATGKGCEDRRLAIDLLEQHRAVLLDMPLVRQRPGPAQFTDPERVRIEMLSLIEDYGALFARLDGTGLLRRRALARVHERSGMHYLEKGELGPAAGDLARAVLLWPLIANPWRVLINACLGRLRRRPRPQAPDNTTVRSAQCPAK
jgi:glycosyltransferase involved in cell wall biosynthesis